MNRPVGGLWVRSLTLEREAVGGEGKACAYCDVSLAGARCVSRRVSTGFGAANVKDETFCDRHCRGLYDERGPKDASQWARIGGEATHPPQHAGTLSGRRRGRRRANRRDRRI